MKKLKLFSRTFILLAICLLMISLATAEIYKWVDENGVVHFSDSIPQEAVSSGNLEAIPEDDSKVISIPGSSSKNPTKKSKSSTKISTKSRKQKNVKVELYITSWCPYCKKAIHFFRSRGIPFREYDIEKDKNAARRKKQLDSRDGVPLAVINGKCIHGFSKGAYEQALR